MHVREHDLPGVGKKFAIVTNDGDRLTVIIHNTGHRELYLFQRGDEYPSLALRLEDAEARQLGALLGGAYFQPPVAESMDMILGQLSMEWLRVEPGSPVAGRTLADSAIRERSGASVLAILRGDRALANPAPQETIHSGDILVVVGDREQVQRARRLVRGSG